MASIPASAVSSRPLPQARPSFLRRSWLGIAVVLTGLYASLPWLAPVFMRLGWTGGAQAIYAVYSTQCHQLPQRSLFLFGPKAMYSLAELSAAGQPTGDLLALRGYTGAPEMGWKIAWSDRMTAMYLSLFVFTLLYRPLLRPLRMRWWAAALLLLPLVVDGTSHLISDFAGIGSGFRDSNLWLANLTGNALPPRFYAGDALGSFNSWMRWISGVLFGLGIAGILLPQIEAAVGDAER